MTVYSPAQIAAALGQAGFPASEIPTGVAIAMAESGGDSDATNLVGPTGEYSVGPFQINLGVGGHSGSINEPTARDLQGAANYAYQLWMGRGGNFSDWSTYTNGAYKQYTGGGMSQPNVPGSSGGVGGDPNNPFGIKSIEPVGYDKIKVTYNNGQQELQSIGGSAGRGPTITGARAPGDVYAAASPQLVGTAAPSPANAGTLMLDYYDRLVQQGQLTSDQALNQFKENMNRAQIMNDDIRARQIAQSQQSVGLAQEAGNRAQTVARDILPNALPNTQALNIPMLGRMPLAQVNTDQLFNQGLPPLAQIPGIPQQPAEQYPGQLSLPPLNLPQVPDVSGYAGQAAGGFPGFQQPAFPGYSVPGFPGWNMG